MNDTFQITNQLSKAIGDLMPASWDLSTMNKILWVDPDGYSHKTAGVGTFDTPYYSINWALSRAEPGTIVMLKPGTYNESVKFENIVRDTPISGSDTSPILLMSMEGPESTVIDNGSQYFPPIWADGSDNIGIIGINVIANGDGKFKDISGIKIGSNTSTPDQAEHILVANNIIDGSGFDGIKFYNANDIFVTGNTIHGVFTEEAIDNVAVRNATYAYNQTDGIYGYSGITMKFGSMNFDIYGNHFDQFGPRALQIGGFGEYAAYNKDPSYYEFEAKNINVHDNYVRVKPIDFDIRTYAIENGLLREDGAMIKLFDTRPNPILGVRADDPTTYRQGGYTFGLNGAHDTTITNNYFTIEESYREGHLSGFKIGSGTNGPSLGGIIDDNKIIFTNIAGERGYDLSEVLQSAADMGVTITDNNGVSVSWNALTGAEQIDAAYDLLTQQVLNWYHGLANTDPVIRGGVENDALQGGILDDTMFGGDGSDSMVGDNGQDVMNGGNGNDTIDGAWGHDALYGNAGNDRLIGGEGNDTLDGGIGNDYFEAGNGNDRALGGDGNDYMAGGYGDDTLEGGAGTDNLIGSWGNDSLVGGDGNDRLEGGAGNDRFEAGDGNDNVLGGDGDDYLSAGKGDDRIEGNAGTDNLIGSWGNDTLLGGDGNDRLESGNDNDLLIGGAGSNTSYGGLGNDKIVSGTGTDIVYGGVGLDMFVFTANGTGHVIVRDYEAGEAISFTNMNELTNGVRMSGAALVHEYLTVTDSAAGVQILLDRDGHNATAFPAEAILLSGYHDVASVELALTSTMGGFTF